MSSTSPSSERRCRTKARSRLCSCCTTSAMRWSCSTVHRSMLSTFSITLIDDGVGWILYQAPLCVGSALSSSSVGLRTLTGNVGRLTQWCHSGGGGTRRQPPTPVSCVGLRPMPIALVSDTRGYVHLYFYHSFFSLLSSNGELFYLYVGFYSAFLTVIVAARSSESASPDHGAHPSELVVL